MAEVDYPLLIFSKPERAERTRRFGRGGNLRCPEPATQGARLTPRFERLQQLMAERRLEIRLDLFPSCRDRVLPNSLEELALTKLMTPYWHK